MWLRRLGEWARDCFALNYLLMSLWILVDARVGGTSPSPTVVAETGNDFRSAACHSHVYELSISSFASVWMLINVVVFSCSFGVFMKHCCYKTFTSDTSKGY